MISSNEKQHPHYLAIKNLNAILKKMTEHGGDYCLDCFKLFGNKKPLKIRV